MAKLKDKIKKVSFYWLYYVSGILTILVGLVFAPIWNDLNNKYDWHIPFASYYKTAIGILMAIIIFIYIGLFLIKRIRKPNLTKNVKITYALEISFLVVIATLAIIRSFIERFEIFNPCIILALVLWVRGISEMISSYYYEPTTNNTYPFWYLLVNIFIISIALPILFLGIQYHDKVSLIVSYSFCFFLVGLGAFLIVLGKLAKPLISPIANEKKENKKENKITELKKDDFHEEQFDIKNDDKIDYDDIDDSAIVLQNEETSIDDGRIVMENLTIVADKNNKKDN